jgi:hypothetical protein
MGNEELEAVKKQLAAMKKIELMGFTNTETATAYFQEKEAILEVEIPSKADGADGTTLIFRKQELLEFSICNVPANPWALTKPLVLSKTAHIKKPETTQELGGSAFWGCLINTL